MFIAKGTLVKFFYSQGEEMIGNLKAELHYFVKFAV